VGKILSTLWVYNLISSYYPSIDTTIFEFMHSRIIQEEKQAQDSYDSKTLKGSRTLMCAVDGSDGSDLAFQTMMVMRRKLDHVCMFHAYSLEKEAYLPPHYHKDEILYHYQQELTNNFHLPTTKFSLYWEDRKGRSVKEVISDFLGEFVGIRNPMSGTRRPPDFFFCGFSGRKRVRSHSANSIADRKAEYKDNMFRSISEGDMTDDKESDGGKEAGPSRYRERASSNDLTLGSTADFASRNLRVPVVIVKLELLADTNRCFVVAVDGSELSMRGFRLALTLVGPHDRVRCVTVAHPQSDYTDEIRAEYEAIFPTLPVSDCAYEVINRPDRCSIAQTLCRYALDQEADFIVVSPRPAEDLSSVTEYIICNSFCSVILAK